jgi:signal transduction histidine kinase/CheY-like chemotaxis protein
MVGSDRSGPTRLLAAAVALVLAAMTVAGFLVTRRSARNEQEHLLGERASEVAAILSTAVSLQTSLALIGDVYAAGDSAGAAFAAGAGSLVTGAVTTVGVAEVTGDRVVVRASEGAGTAVGTELTGTRAELVRRAVGAGGLTSAVVRGAPLSTLVVALARPSGVVAFEESAFANTPVPATPGSPFEELDAALYRSATPDPAQLLVATTDHLPLPEPRDTRTLAFGAETWVLETSARRSLISAQARAVPWIILGGGLATALLVGGLVDMLSRRRAYALGVVEQRTGDLRRAMADLEAARGAADMANKAKSEFLSRMSHELRTPLNSVLGFAQLLELNDLAADDRDAVEHILKGGHHLLDLINEVLDISRIESGDLALSIESVRAGDVVGEALDLIRPMAAARTIHVVGDDRLACAHYVFADRQRLKQVLLNLLSNAVKYNRVGGRVGVACAEVAGTRLRLKVVDTGPGISEHDQQLLFVPFERLGAELTDVDGTGIGLALSRRLAEAMGGTLGLESTVGSGSTFWIELPLVEGAVERYERLAPTAAPLPAGVPSPERRRILYIEDNLANITLVQRILAGRTDIELVPAMQGRLGLELAREHRPALILMDLHLPDVSGEEVLHDLREDPATRKIPVIVVSADATTGQVQRLQAAGASAYLTKPFNVRALLESVDDALAGVGADGPGSAAG